MRISNKLNITHQGRYSKNGLRLLPIVVIFAACHFAKADAPLAGKQEASSNSVAMPLNQFLWESGRKVGVYFTVEQVPQKYEDSTRTVFSFGQVKADMGKIHTPEEIVQTLKQSFAASEEVTYDKANRIISIRDSSLSARRDDVLDRKVDIVCKSNLANLVMGLSAQTGQAIILDNTLNLTESPDYGMKTKIKLNAKENTIRQILTLAVPLRPDYPVLWRATVTSQGTYVRYYQP